MFTEDSVRTKDEIMVEIKSYQETLEQLSDQTRDDVKNIIKNLKGNIADLEAEYKTAPDQHKRTPSTTMLQTDKYGSSLYVFAELGKAAPAHFIVGNNPGRSDFSFNNDGTGLYYPVSNRAGELSGLPRGMAMKREDAEQLVLKCLSDVGIEGMQIVDVQTQNYLNSFKDVNNNTYMKAANQCYAFTLIKTVKGIPLLLIQSSVSLDTDDPNAPAYKGPEYADIPDPEYISVYVDDTGIVRFEWYNPSAVTSILSDQVTLLPFADIAERAKNNIFYKNYTAYGSTADIYINRIELNMMRIMRKDKPSEYLIVPVWDFIGDVKQSFEGEEPRLSSFQDRSYVTINAIDGSWINRDWGY